jgi:fringe protein
MQHRIRYSSLYSRLLISLILSISVSLSLILITNERPNFYFTYNKSTTIADRIVLFVRSSNNCQSRLTYLLQSWISTNQFEQTNLYLITDHITNQTNLTILNSFKNIVRTNCPQTHNRFDLCCKTAHEFNLYYNLTTKNPNLEWMCRFDDDQYVNLKNLYKYLSELNSFKPYYIGRTSINQRLTVENDNRTYTFATYGAGVCFSHTLLKQLYPYVHIKNLPEGCLKRGISDDAYIGYLIEMVLNISLTSINDLFHSHLEKLDESFRYFSLNDLSRVITFGFSWDRYTLEWLPIIHQLIKLINQNQIEAANYLWLFLRNYEKEHPTNLTNRYDRSCISYQILQNRSINLQTRKTKPTTRRFRKH